MVDAAFGVAPGNVIGPVTESRSLITCGVTAMTPSNVVEVFAYSPDVSNILIVSDADVGKSKNQFASAGRNAVSSNCSGRGRFDLLFEREIHIRNIMKCNIGNLPITYRDIRITSQKSSARTHLRWVLKEY